MAAYEDKVEQPQDEEVHVKLAPSMLSEIDDFAWYRYLDRDEAIRRLLAHGLAEQARIQTRYGDRRQGPDEVIVDSRLEWRR